MSISLGDPDFFKKVNAARPDLFDQEKMADNIAKEDAKKQPLNQQELRDEVFADRTLKENLQMIVAKAATGHTYLELQEGSEDELELDLKEELAAIDKTVNLLAHLYTRHTQAALTAFADGVEGLIDGTKVHNAKFPSTIEHDKLRAEQRQALAQLRKEAGIDPASEDDGRAF